MMKGKAIARFNVTMETRTQTVMMGPSLATRTSKYAGRSSIGDSFNVKATLNEDWLIVQSTYE